MDLDKVVRKLENTSLLDWEVEENNDVYRLSYVNDDNETLFFFDNIKLDGLTKWFSYKLIIDKNIVDIPFMDRIGYYSVIRSKVKRLLISKRYGSVEVPSYTLPVDRPATATTVVNEAATSVNMDDRGGVTITTNTGNIVVNDNGVFINGEDVTPSRTPYRVNPESIKVNMYNSGDRIETSTTTIMGGEPVNKDTLRESIKRRAELMRRGELSTKVKDLSRELSRESDKIRQSLQDIRNQMNNMRNE
jgi:hypothetical protein